MVAFLLAFLSIFSCEDSPENVANNQFMRAASLTPGIRSVACRDGGGYDVTFMAGEWSPMREQIVRDLAAAYQLAPVFVGEEEEQEDDEPC